MNIYEMYYENDKQFGFWVKRNSWSFSLAKVISIEGVEEGNDIEGNPPYFMNQKVTADFYKGTIKDGCYLGEKDFDLTCGGTYAYEMIRENISIVSDPSIITLPEPIEQNQVWFGKWHVSKKGVMTYDDGRYVLSELHVRYDEDMIQHMFTKSWIDWNEFIPAYFQALKNLGIKRKIERIY